MTETIAIIGTGRMGGAFAARFNDLGYQTLLASREPESDRVKDIVKGFSNASATSLKEAVQKADIIVLAIPYTGFSAVAETLGDLDGKIALDCTNALKMAGDGLMCMASDSSSGEELTDMFPKARLVKAFNTVGYHIIAKPESAPGTVTTLLAGNDEKAKSRIQALGHELGFETADVGPIRQSRFLEGMSALYLTPYLQGRAADAFEFYLRQGTTSKVKTPRAAG